MTDEQYEHIQTAVKVITVAFPVVLCLLLLMLVFKVGNVSKEISLLPAQINKGMVLPAGVYICDGERCVIANSANLQK